MRLTSFVRRSTALAAATALISSGGAASGLLAGTAFAALPQPVVTSLSTSSWDNRSTLTLTVGGSNFLPGDKVVFKPAAPDPAHEVNEFSVTSSSSSTPTSLVASVPLAMAPAGGYRVVVRHPAPDNTESASPSQPNFTVTGLGDANARSVAYGAPATGVDPLGVDCATGAITNCTARGENPLDISGSNFAVGASVNFLLPGSPPVNDAKITFAPGNPENGANPPGTVSTGTGYPSTTLLQGNFHLPADVDANTPGFTPGRHLLQVVNTDGLTTGTTTDIYFPWFRFADVSPNALGAGVSTHIVTVTGQGIRPGSQLVITTDTYNVSEACSGKTDITVGNSSVNATGTAISAPVTIASCAHTTARDVKIVGPDGGRFVRAGAFTVLAPPTVARSNITLGQGALPHTFTLTGTGFVNGATEADRTSFTYGDGSGVHVHTVDVPTSTQATVNIDVDQNATVGNRTVTVTNPNNGGSTTTGSGGTPTTWPMTIVAGPKVASLSQTSFPRTTPSSVSVTAKGSGFDATATQFVSVSPDNTGVFITNGSITKAGSTNPVLGTPATDEATFTVDTSNATPGQYDLIFTNASAQGYGRFVCTGCLGVDSLGVVKVNGNPVLTGQLAQHNNTGTANLLTFQGQTAAGLGLDKVTGAATATLTHLLDPGQPTIAATGALVPGTAGSNQATGSFDLTNVAPGSYNVTVRDASLPSTPTWTCVGCFTVTASTFTTTSITPSAGGAGAVNRLVTLKGTNFSKGMSVSIPQATVHDVTFVDPQTITAQVDIPAAATPTANETVTVTAGDGSTTTNLTFSIDAPPSGVTVTSPSPAAYGQGAGTSPGSTLKMSVTATGLDNGAVFSLGDSAISLSGFSVSQDPSNLPTCAATSTCKQIVQATIQVGQGAALGKHDVTVTNSDGGAATLAGGFTVNPGPKVLSVADETGAPALRPDGVQHDITVLGSGYDTTKGVTVAITPGGVTPTAVTVVSGNKITLKVTVPASEPLGPRTVSVLNTGDGGYGTCAVSPAPCVYVATAPGSPAPLTLAGGPRSLGVSWAAAAPNGAQVTAYRLAYAQVGVSSPTLVNLPASARSYAITGLTNGVAYNVAVLAVNAVGLGPAALGTGVAGLTASLSLATTTTRTVYGGKVIVTGRLLGVGGAPLAGRTVVLSFTPALGRGYVRVVSTNLGGAFSLGVISPYSVRVQALWAGDASYRITASSYRAWSVAARVLKTAPVSGSTSRASTVLTIAGTVAPNKSGRIVYLLRYVNHRWYVVQRARVTSRSTYAFALKPARGAYVFRVTIGATPGNTAGGTGAFRLNRV